MSLGDLKDSGESDGSLFADINITPLTDIFLVLLIIFMVTTTAITSSEKKPGGFDVNLPKGGSTATAPTIQLAVAVLADGKTILDGKALDSVDLRTRFTDAASKSRDTLVMIQADRSVAHGRVVEVMEMARQAGLNRLAIATVANDK